MTVQANQLVKTVTCFETGFCFCIGCDI